ncbi:hypothetical protein LTR03_000195 [Friedmanniomyces endolithicus]|nr:hypothetical protein LTR03_000195 [Friedmanniomyces endolithicus]
MGSPEVLTPYQQQEKAAQEYYAQQDTRPHYVGGPPPGYQSTAGQAEVQTAGTRRERNVCGFKHNVFCTVLAIEIVVFLAAVLGGVLGTVLNKSGPNNQPSPISNGSIPSNTSSPATPPPVTAYQNSGISLLVPAHSSDELPAFYFYFQNVEGAIIEDAYNSTTMHVSSNSTLPVAGGAANGTPIAATSWFSNSHTTRQVFFLDSSGDVMTSNTTGSRPWSTPYNVLTGDSVEPSTNALAVCSATAAQNTGLDGIRVHYGSGSCPGTTSSECIREVGMDFFESTQPTWHMWATFPGSDVKSGVACAVSNNVNHLYLRNNTNNGLIQQWQWSYTDQYENGDAFWSMTTTGPSNMTDGSDIAALNHGSNTDYIFYQTATGQVERALYYGSAIGNFMPLETASVGTKLTAAHTNYSGIVVYQKPLNGSLSYDMVMRSGQEVGTGLVV